jgi:hypothetical protein
MIIIGGGIAGRMAAGYFSHFNPEVYEARKDETSNHKAIMRFRDFSIGYLLGTPLEKIHVTKAIYSEGHFVEPNPGVLNRYSRKVARGIYPRSIRFTEPVERFIAKEPFHFQSAKYGHSLVKIVEPNKCLFNISGSRDYAVDYDVCISTIPLPVMAKAAGIDVGKTKIESYPICITHYKVDVPSKVYQTIYFPDLSMSIYRASLEHQDLIIESLSETIGLEIPDICSAFGLFEDNLKDMQRYTQENGKIIEIDDATRKKVLMELTEKYHIYSLGRYATWRNITSDVLIGDLDRIAGMMKMSPSARKYSMKLEASNES